jgi:hypothetical protein
MVGSVTALWYTGAIALRASDLHFSALECPGITTVKGRVVGAPNHP